MPVVWLKLTLLAFGAPVPLDAAPSTVTSPAVDWVKFAVTDLSALIVTEHGAVPVHAAPAGGEDPARVRRRGDGDNRPLGVDVYAGGRDRRPRTSQFTAAFRL